MNPYLLCVTAFVYIVEVEKIMADAPVPFEKDTVLRGRHLAGTEKVLYETPPGGK